MIIASLSTGKRSLADISPCSTIGELSSSTDLVSISCGDISTDFDCDCTFFSGNTSGLSFINFDSEPTLSLLSENSSVSLATLDTTSTCPVSIGVSDVSSVFL